VALYDNLCPSCGEVIPARVVPARQSGATGFPCPACGRKLRTARVPITLTLPITIAISLFSCYSFGLRGFTAVAVFVLALLPVYFVVYVAIGLVVSPPLELFPDQSDQGRKPKKIPGP
jgi:hypothetical protein